MKTELYSNVIHRTAHKRRQQDRGVADKNGKFEKEYPNDEGGINWVYVSGLKPFQKIRLIKEKKRKG